MVTYEIVYAKRAAKQVKYLKAAGLVEKAQALVALIKSNPYQTPPPYEKLIGDLQGSYSRRINHQHRLVYQVDDENRLVRILSLWSHYEQ